MRSGTVYTETIVHLGPERFASMAPYQVAIVDLEDGTRLTALIAGDRVIIGERVSEAPPDNGMPVFPEPPSPPTSRECRWDRPSACQGE